MEKKKLGEVLLKGECISAENLGKALEEQQRTSTALGELLLDRGAVSKNDLVVALEQVTHFPYLDARLVPADGTLLELVPCHVAVRHCVLPVARRGHRLVVVMAEPQNLRTIDELRFLCGMDILPRLGFRQEIKEAIQRHYGPAGPAVEAEEAKSKPSFIEQVDVSGMQFFTASSSERSKAAIEEFEADLRKERTPAVHLASAVISSAVTKNASDIHIEPLASGGVVRIRVDGLLRELAQIPDELETPLVSRIKILADMDIAERRLPQDGRFLVQIGSRRLDIRASTLPTHYGEKVVLRLLDPSVVQVSFEDLGMPPENAQKLASLLAMPQGMLLVTGPTGSGKTTLLYAALNAIRSSNINIVTVEDPIEYKIEGINQVQINPKAGLTFASGLRAILRQDPNVIMVGEIRDTETAEIALEAAQTGHLVLSTLHTNDSVSAIPRLLDLNIPAFLIAPSVTGVTAQRLVRKLCSCRKEVPMTPEYALRLLASGAVDFGDKMYVPVGCEACDYTAYKGRVGIYEMLVFDEEIRDRVREKVRDVELRNLARDRGMRRMQEHALMKVKMGLTTLEEVFRVVPFDDSNLRCHKCGKELAPMFLFCPYCGIETRRITPEARAVLTCHTATEGAV